MGPKNFKLYHPVHQLRQNALHRQQRMDMQNSRTDEDRKNLIEAGFHFVEQANNKSFYRKQK